MKGSKHKMKVTKATVGILLGSVVPLLAEPELNLVRDTEQQKWKSVNDTVMGGVSKGESVLTAQSNRLFKGVISLENNGGFASIRTSGAKYDLSEYTGLEIKVKGDGRLYYLTARNSSRGTFAYWSPVQPANGKWETYQIPFKSFYATSFGRKIPKLKLNTKKIMSVGFMLFDKKDGAFSLEIESIRPYK